MARGIHRRQKPAWQKIRKPFPSKEKKPLKEKKSSKKGQSRAVSLPRP